MLSDDDKGKILKAIVEATQKYAVLNGYEKPTTPAEHEMLKAIEPEKLSERDKKLMALLDKNWPAGSGDAIRELATLLSGFDVAKYTNSRKGGKVNECHVVPLAAIVPLKNTNSHVYPLNQVAIALRGTMLVSITGPGNNFDYARKNSRPATLDEITDLPEGLYERIAECFVVI